MAEPRPFVFIICVLRRDKRSGKECLISQCYQSKTTRSSLDSVLIKPLSISVRLFATDNETALCVAGFTKKIRQIRFANMTRQISGQG